MDAIESANDPAEYLENIGMDVTRCGDGTAKVKSGTTEDGKTIYLIVAIDDIPELMEVYHANTSVEDIFDEYVIDRVVE